MPGPTASRAPCKYGCGRRILNELPDSAVDPDSVIPPDYEERVYAGILGKLIGVYLGRPVENWTYERITRELGEVTNYVNGHPRVTRRIPIVVSDDDVTGTFTFLRALSDYGATRSLTPAQIGQT